MSVTSLRLVGAGILIYLAVYGAGLAVAPPPGAYEGPLSGVHKAAGQMAQGDRAALAEALATAGTMLESDTLGLVGTTEELQRFVKAALEFDYIALGKPTAKYPAVAAAVQAALDDAIGEDVVPVTPAIRSRVSAALAEAGKAVR